MPCLNATKSSQLNKKMSGVTKVVPNTDLTQQTIEATPGIEIHENCHPQSCSASISHLITRVQRPTSRQSPSFRISVHGVVPNPYETEFTLFNQPILKVGIFTGFFSFLVCKWVTIIIWVLTVILHNCTCVYSAITNVWIQ